MVDALLIELQGADVGYGGTPIIRNVDLRVAPGDFMGFAGPNGAGKSTLLKTMLGIIPALGGTVRRQAGLRLGYVPQRSRIDPLFPQTAFEVVRQGGLGQGGRFGFRPAAADEAFAALSRLDISSLHQRRYRDLSGGQQQRVLIARALVRNPELLVLDEPTEGLDLPSEKQILDFISSLNQQRNMTVILVAHKLSIIADRAGLVVLVNKDTGFFVSGGSAEILTDVRLSEVYGTPMVTEYKGGRLVSVRAGEKSEASA